MSAEAGGVAHTVLVRDVPGLPYGTVAARIEDTALRFLPRFVKKRLVVRQIISCLWSVFHVLITLSWVSFWYSSCRFAACSHAPQLLC